MDVKVLISGGSGLIGSQLSNSLQHKGYEVVHLSRDKNESSKFRTFNWNIESGFIEEGTFKNVKHIIHLAGAGIADKRWTPKRKQELINSRVESANLIYQYLKTSNHKVESFISASAIGIYGFDTGGILQTEDRLQLGDDYLATLTKKWEVAADQFSDLGARVVKLRIGLVLSNKGGILEKLLPVVKIGMGSAFGSGEQYMSWIHIDDLVRIFIEVVENAEIIGIYNAVAPNPVTNKDFIKILTRVINKPYFLPNTPKFVLKILLGELSSAITGGNNVSSNKIESTGFNFQFIELVEAMKDLIKK